MTGTNCDVFTRNQSRSYLNHLVFNAFLLLHGKNGYANVPQCYVMGTLPVL
jgi:hypothetical protein